MNETSGTSRDNPVSERILRVMARSAVEAGYLPTRRPDRVLGRPSVGAECAVCGAPVNRDELEFEIEFFLDGVPDGRVHHLHISCFSALEIERRDMELTRGGLFPGDRAQKANGPKL
jgi:hypothetical protein